MTTRVPQQGLRRVARIRIKFRGSPSLLDQNKSLLPRPRGLRPRRVPEFEVQTKLGGEPSGDQESSLDTPYRDSRSSTESVEIQDITSVSQVSRSNTDRRAGTHNSLNIYQCGKGYERENAQRPLASEVIALDTIIAPSCNGKSDTNLLLERGGGLPGHVMPGPDCRPATF